MIRFYSDFSFLYQHQYYYQIFLLHRLFVI
nr:MAG TPA: hypothetical protein [Bacteriophage sp.]